MNQLQKYLNGQMEAEEMEQYTELLLRKKFEKEQKEKWRTVLKEEYGVDREHDSAKSKSTRIRTLSWVMGIAAAVSLLITVFFLINKPSEATPQQLADTYIQNLPIMADQSVFRKGQFEEEAVRIQANEAYMEGNFERAIRYWQELQANGKASRYDRFYLGISYLRQEAAAPAKAIPLLESAKADSPELIQEINWVLALAYIKTDQLNEAQALLQSIVDKDAYMADHAAKLLTALRSD